MRKIIITIIGTLTIATCFGTSRTNIKVANKIKKIEAKYGGKIGLYSINRNNWHNFSHHSSFYFPICSTYKFLVVGAILKQSMTNENLLEEEVKIPEHEIVEHSPITKKHASKEMTIKQLCKASIKGDNTATNLLINKLGGLKKLRDFNLSLKDHATKVANLEPKVNEVDLTTNLNKTTPKILTRDINKLAFSNEILDKKHRIMFKKWLKDNNTGYDRIAAEVPDHWDVGDKTGTCQYGTTNDVAIIWPDDGRAVAMSIFYTQPHKEAKPNNKVIKKTAKVVLDKLQVNNDSKKDA